VSPDPQAKVILDDLRELANLFDLELPRDGGVLGEKLLDIAAAGVADCFLTESDPDGSAWAPLSESYAEMKAERVGGKPIGELYGLMSDPQQIRGERVVRADSAVMTYGVTDDAKAEAVWFQDPETGRNQPPRAFYALTREAVALANDMLDQHFSKHTR
jgi:hypothetical protein